MASTSLLATAFGALLLFQIWRVVQRLYFHPLSSVPGPKMAAATTLYEFYWNAICGGKLFLRWEEMHKKYGPIVRLGPNEVHISDPTYWDVLYNSTNKLDKYARFYCFDAGTNIAGVTTVKHEVHRRRRGAISKFLSAANVAKLEPRVHVHLKKMLDRFDEFGRAGKPCDCFNAFRSLTMDVISMFCEPTPRHNLDAPDFDPPMHRTIRTAAQTMDIQKFIPIMQIMDLVPISVWRYLDPEVTKLVEKREVLRNTAKQIAAEGGNPSSREMTVMDAIASSDLLPPEDKTPLRMAYEAEMVLGAGTETTSNTLGNLVFYVLSNPKVHERLRNEVLSCSTAPTDELVDFQTLNKLPYLTAVIQESLRVASPVSGRLPRVNPTSPMTYTTPGPHPTTYTFPPGTVMSMSQRDLHNNPDIFPDPEKFEPERWLPATDPTCTVTPEQRRLMDRYWVPFSRGSRNCIGLELAKQELGLATGNLFRRFDLELFETTERDVRAEHDFFAPYAAADSEGVRVKIKY
ncbi:cytochrome P450 monooxygenase aflU [Lasiodiplodia hormozganensis]|uniref:Cytochrome P450 monooxygenase aflU n=1 Tax=Lasiodiplodia hormozganensis TaxID=869390 RepID=A0AA39YVX7_9PEZI|nr:cytochrome P450 monooxygenase aflU [Lasiodiplodia hormozganensis]